MILKKLIRKRDLTPNPNPNTSPHTHLNLPTIPFWNPVPHVEWLPSRCVPSTFITSWNRQLLVKMDFLIEECYRHLQISLKTLSDNPTNTPHLSLGSIKLKCSPATPATVTTCVNQYVVEMLIRIWDRLLLCGSVAVWDLCLLESGDRYWFSLTCLQIPTSTGRTQQPNSHTVTPTPPFRRAFWVDYLG